MDVSAARYDDGLKENIERGWDRTAHPCVLGLGTASCSVVRWLRRCALLTASSLKEHPIYVVIGVANALLLGAQIQRVSLETSIPNLIEAIADNAGHTDSTFLQDPDVMVVYLEQLVCSIHPFCDPDAHM